MPLYLGSNKVRGGMIMIEQNPIIDISDPDALTAELSVDNVGNVYRYTGETNSTYTNGDLYEVVEV